jgi:hypothetical protein
MGELNTARINAAVHACLDQCYHSRTPLKAIAEYINQLEVDPGWSEAEIDQVEAAVLKMLVKIAGRPPAADGDLLGPIAPPHIPPPAHYPNAESPSS